MRDNRGTTTLRRKRRNADPMQAYDRLPAELRGWLPLFDIHLDDAHANRVLAAAEAALTSYTDSAGAARFPTSAHILTARKPL